MSKAAALVRSRTGSSASGGLVAPWKRRQRAPAAASKPPTIRPPRNAGQSAPTKRACRNASPLAPTPTSIHRQGFARFHPASAVGTTLAPAIVAVPRFGNHLVPWPRVPRSRDYRQNTRSGGKLQGDPADCRERASQVSAAAPERPFARTKTWEPRQLARFMQTEWPLG